MAYQALVFCTDPKVNQVLAVVLGELDFAVESCHGPFDAVKKLTERPFDALLVDCSDEQNAALLFKSARNSEINSAALAVAVVEDQAAISKAFRIGANLILTKPINIEQAKGTLRVARGLLKKSQLGKALSPAASTSTTAGTFPDKVISQKSNVDQMIPSAAAAKMPQLEADPSSFPAPMLELEEEEIAAPPLGPAEAAFLESVPEVLPEQPSVGLAHKQAAWKSVFTPGDEVVPAAEPESLPSPEPASPVGHSVGSGLGAAAAVAPAKEETPFEFPPIANQEEPPPAEVAPEEKAPKASKKTSKGKSRGANADKFSWQDAARKQDESEERNSSKNLAIAAVLVLVLAGAGYFAWPRLGPILMNLPFVQKYVLPHLGMAEPATHTVLPSQGANSPTPTTGASTATAPAPTNSSSVVIAPESGIKPDAGTPLSTEQPSNPTAQVITVKSGSTETKPVSGHALPPPEMNPSGSGDQTVSGLVNTTPAVPKPMEGLHVPEATMESLLTRKVQPIYPTLAAQMRVEGTVLLTARIGKDGAIMSLKPVRGDQMLIKAATDAVRQWKYKPYVLGGQPLEVQTEITVTFKLP